VHPDFGKRELSPALRSRFTEIWVPPVTQRSDVDLVLERSLLSYTNTHDEDLDMLTSLRSLMLNYVEWFNDTICNDPTTFCNDFKLSLRDVLSWARFIADVSVKRQIISAYSAFLHGAALMHLDGIGLGTGVSNHDASATRDKAKAYLLQQIAPMCESLDIVGFKDELKELQESLIDTDDLFGIRPFTIPKGQNTIPTDAKFHMTAPTTGMNLRRVLRGMQISKPILLEGSPGVGKTR
jgi:midasin